MDPLSPVLLDVESRSRADLETVGGRQYWTDRTSEILVCVWYDTRDGSVGAWVPGMSWPHHDRILAAHNAHGFDRFALAAYGIHGAGWIDTSQLARKAGLPGALDALGTRWLGLPKDKAASDYTKSLSRVSRPTAKAAKAGGPPAIPIKVWAAMTDDERYEHGVRPEYDARRVLDYCASDVAILAGTWDRLAEWLSVDAPAEALDHVLNDRGICFDASLARCLLVNDTRNTEAVIAEVARQFACSPADVRTAASPANLCAILGLDNAQASTIEGIDHPLVRVRQAVASIARGKLQAGLARVGADGRLRDTMQYYGAHTGRWSSSGMQLHNLPRPDAKYEDLPEDTPLPYTLTKKGERAVDVDALADMVLAGEPCDAETIELLVRATLTASPGHVLVARDFASVEARATAWAARDLDELAVYHNGLDPYKVAASQVYACTYADVTKAQRAIGKICILALGYQGANAAFTKFAKVYRVDLSALDVGAIVKAWRAAHRQIVNLWYSCERAFRSAVRGTNAFAGPFEFVAGDGAVACFLPSGRPIVYQGAAAHGDRNLTYEGKCVEHVYGGLLVENAIQGMCRDLMSDALLRAEAAGLNPVLTVHDEIVCDVPEADAERAEQALHACMVTLPDWAAGFPIGADGWRGKRYRK